MTNMDVVDDSSLSWMLVNGSAKLGASELDDQMLAPFAENAPPKGPADATKLFAINQTDIVTWVVDGQPLSEPQNPIIYGGVSDGWNAVTTIHMPANSTIDLIMHVANDSMDTVSRGVLSRSSRQIVANQSMSRWVIPCTFMVTNFGFWGRVKASSHTIL